jgi:hypothetical protein
MIRVGWPEAFSSKIIQLEDQYVIGFKNQNNILKDKQWKNY